MRHPPSRMSASPATCSARSRKCSLIRVPMLSPNWAAISACTPMAMITGMRGRRTRPRLNPIASSSRLMLTPRR